MGKTNIVIKTKIREFIVPEGKPVMVHWRSKNKSRPGKCTGIGWIKPGDRPHTIKLVHQTFCTYDEAEAEYSSCWSIYESQITDICILKGIRYGNV